MSAGSDLAGMVPALVGGAIGVAVGKRRVVAKQMPESAERWLALTAGERLRIRWAVVRGEAVGDARLAPMAVALARMTSKMWARLSWRKYVGSMAFFAVVIVASLLLLPTAPAVVCAVLGLTSLVGEACTAPSRTARLARAEERNLRLVALPPR